MTKKKIFFIFAALFFLLFMNRNRFLSLGIQVVCCAALIYWFYTHSYIRPYTIFHPYKEIICALLVISLIYLNYYVLTPYFIKCRYCTKYIFISLLVTGIFSIAELQIVKTDIIRCIGYDKSAIDNYLYNILFVLFLRDLGFYAVFTLIWRYVQAKANITSIKQEVLQSTGLVLLQPHRGDPISINIDFVSYFTQNKNYTFIHSIIGKSASIYSSLNSIQDYLKDYCLRINKDTIITFTNIINYNTNSVVVREDRNNAKKSLPFFKKDAEKILNTLREKVPELEEKNKTTIPTNDIFDGVTHQNSDEKIGNDGVNTLILEEIKRKEGIHVYQLAEIFKGRISLRTIERRLKELKDAGVIEFRGADKNGGYFVK